METSFYEQSETQSLWELIVNVGYLTVDKVIEEGYYRIRIPNQEIQREFQSLTAFSLKISGTVLSDLYRGIRV